MLRSPRQHRPSGSPEVAAYEPVATRTARFSRTLAGINALVFAGALAVLLVPKLVPALPTADNLAADSWAVGHRDLTVSDRTGDPAWHAAIVQAVATWSQAGTDLRLTVVTQAGPCRQALQTIEYCEQTERMIARPEIPGREGFIAPVVGPHDHFHSVDVVVCSDCPVDQARRVIIATHEMGHSLGLPHNGSPFSVMYPTGGSFGPDAQDLKVLRSKYPPAGAAPG